MVETINNIESILTPTIKIVGCSQIHWFELILDYLYINV